MGTLESKLKLSLIDQISARGKHIVGVLANINRHGLAINGVMSKLMAFGGAYLSITTGTNATYAAAEKLQTGLTEIGIKAGLSNHHLEGLQRQLIALSPKVNQTTSDLLSGVDAMVTLGLATDQAQAAIPAIAKAATATGASIADLAGASTSAIQNMGVMPEQIVKMLDAMALAGNAGAFELKDMAQYFPQLTASAQALGIDGVDGVADLAAALQIARRGAGDASTAANNLSNFMGKIMSPEVSKNFKKFGIDVTKELKKAHKQGISPLEHFIKLVDEKTKGGQADLLAQLFGDKQVQDLVRPMLKDLTDYIKIREDAERATGTVDSAFAKRMENNAEKVKALRISLDNLGTSIGATMLKPVADFADRLAGILNTLDERAGPLDRLRVAMTGFLNGLGVGSFKEIGDALETFFFGIRDGSKAADELGRIFGRFQEFGRQIRQFGEDVGNNPIVKFLGELSPYAWDALKISVGIAVLAGTVRSLASALLLLSGATTLIGMLKAMGKLSALPGFDGASLPGGKNRSNMPDVPAAGWFGRLGTWMKGLGVLSLIGTAPRLLDDTPGDTFEEQVENQRKSQDALRKLLGMKPWHEANDPKRFIGPTRPERLRDPGGYDMAGRFAYANSPAGVAEAAVARAMNKLRMTGTPDHAGKMRDDHNIGVPAAQQDTILDRVRDIFSALPASAKGASTVTLDQASILAATRPSGVQDVRVTNKEPPNVTIHQSISISGVIDPRAAAAAAMSQAGELTKAAVEAADTD